MHAVSLVGACDIASLVAICISLGSHRTYVFNPNYHDDNFIYDMIVPLRTLRCFCIENYAHALHTLLSVFYINRKPMLKSFYSLVCIWYIFGTCLYLTERDAPDGGFRFVGKHSMDVEEEEDEITMKHRYRDILTGLQFALVHITGDYPIADYCARSMPFHFVGCISGMICISSFTGIFVASINNFLRDEHALGRKAEAQRRIDAVMTTILMVQFKFRARRRRHQLALQGL